MSADQDLAHRPRRGWIATVARVLVRCALAVAVLVSALWVGLAFWHQLPFGDILRGIVIAAWLAFAFAVAALEFVRPRWKPRLAYVLALVAVAVWWSGIEPSNDRAFAADVEHGVTGRRDGDLVTLENVRDFDWRSPDAFEPRWRTRRVDLNEIRSVDLFLSYWSGPAIAHTLVSFGFADGAPIVFSAEIRREQGEAFSEVGGFFKEFELALVAAEERDIIRLRTNIRGEDVYRYPLRIPEAGMRELFLSYVDLGNQLAARPEFYNTITANCTTVVFRLIRALDPGLPLDYRILLSGYLPGYIYDRQGHPPGQSLADFMRQAAISARGKAAGDAPDFSARIRAAPP